MADAVARVAVGFFREAAVLAAAVAVAAMAGLVGLVEPSAVMVNLPWRAVMRVLAAVVDGALPEALAEAMPALLRAVLAAQLFKRTAAL
jgi:hypothetical protein